MIWPTQPNGAIFLDKIRLDKTTRLDYLDSIEALPLRTTVAEIIKKHNCKTVVDVGCGVGRMYDFIDVEKYMGFDDDWRLINPGKRARPAADLRIASWKDLDRLDVEFDVDCLLFLGVLSYAMPEYPEVFDKNGLHYNMFHDMVNLYRPKIIIIQEILAEQTLVSASNELQTLPLDYYMNFNPASHELDLPIWCGHRVILEIDSKNVYEAYKTTNVARD